VNVAIIVAGGSGERLGREGGKQLALVAGRPVLTHTLEAFERCETIDGIVVVVHPDRLAEYREVALDPVRPRKVLALVGGGDTRQASVAAGLAAAPLEADIIVVHDGARPLVTPALIERTVRELEADPALDGVAVGHAAFDTVKRVGGDGIVERTEDRAPLWSAQTPQAFWAGRLRAGYAAAEVSGTVGTDDAALVEQAGGRVKMIEGLRENIKVTVAGDVPLVERLLRGRSEGVAVGELRIGTGYDVHAFSEGRPLVLGGVEIPYGRGLAGHSDADVLVHALMDAIVGALREGDIGRLFPDTDEAYRGISSIELLRRVGALMAERGYRLVDADTVVVCEQPRLASYREQMRTRIADALGCGPDRIGVKATTTEGLGFTGRGEGIAAQAVVMLARIDS
jgi:2-C-methyl-D-erythritol 2,4-cyclodiphosphate synthase/2-C-methyl-D-erythritol 4-phosphate cytidylyltransferase